MSSQSRNDPSPQAAANPPGETAAKRNTQKLQRAVVDGLEDVKAQDIRVFNTEALSALFERVIVASGSSNRQTKALAASVCDAVREAGFPKPRVEGQENGEWIIVDCGPVVVHVMQPSIRQYYRLEEIWGSKPVRLKLGAPAPTQARPAGVAAKAKATGSGRSATAKDKPDAAKAKPAKSDDAQAAPARAKPAKPAKPAKQAKDKPDAAKAKPAKSSAGEPAAAAPAKPQSSRTRARPKPAA